MARKEPRLVYYVGKKKLKKDTVCGTGTLWAGYGDSREVDDDVAVRLLQHDDVWVDERTFKAMEEKRKTAEEEPETPAEPPKETEPAIKPQSDRTSRIIEAITKLIEDNNDDAFSANGGFPKIEYVRELTNDPSFSSEEVKAAWKFMQDKKGG